MTLTGDAKQVEKMIEQEAKADERNLQHMIKDLKTADKAHAKGDKAVDKAVHGVDKAINREHKTAQALSKADHKHNVAVQEIAKAQKDVEVRKQHQGNLAEEVRRKRASLDEFQQRKAANDADRESRLASLHQHAADVAARTGTMNTTNTASTGAGGNQQI